MPTLYLYAEGETRQGAICEPLSNPAPPDTEHVGKSLVQELGGLDSAREYSGGVGQGHGRTPAIYAIEKPDTP